MISWCKSYKTTYLDLKKNRTRFDECGNAEYQAFGAVG